MSDRRPTRLLRARSTTFKAGARPYQSLLHDAGKARDALPVAADVVRAAQATGYPAIEGAALLRYGRLQMDMGDANAAEASLYQAAWAADASGDDAVRAHAWATLVYVVGYLEGKFEEVPKLRDQCLAALRRLGGNPQAEAALWGGLAASFIVAGKTEESQDAAQRALSIDEKALGDSTWQVAADLARLANTLPSGDRALDLYARAAQGEIHTAGASQPDVGVIYANMSSMLRQLMRHAEAEAKAREGLGILQAAFGPEHRFVAAALSDLGDALLEQGHYDQAR